MPKDRTPKHELYKRWMEEDTQNFVIIKESIKCTLCNITIYPKQRSDFYRHVKSKTHTDRKLGTCSTTSRDFNLKLAKAFLTSNITFNKLRNPHLHQFLEEACNQKIPDPSTLHKYYIDKVYAETISLIRKDIDSNYVYVIINETVDSCGRHIGNFLIGALTGNPSKTHLLACKEIKNTEHKTILQYFNDCLRILWGNSDIVTDKLLLLITDATSYMIKAGETLKTKFPLLIHLTCLAHGLNRVAEQTCVEVPQVDQLIEIVRKIFVKVPSRIHKFREMLPDVPLPPEPIFTRWGTWIDAAEYYDKYFDGVKSVVSSLDSTECSYIDEAVTLFNNPVLKTQVNAVKQFSVISSSMKTLETSSGLPLKTALNVISMLEHKLDKNRSGISRQIKARLCLVLDENPGYSTLKCINESIDGAYSAPVSAELVKLFKFCPTTNVDIERFCSEFKAILDERRHSVTMSNLEKRIVVYYAYNYSEIQA